MVLVSLQWIKGYQFFDSNGDPLAAGTINMYDSGTTSVRTTYSERTGTTPNTLNASNQIVLDSTGRLDESVYIPTGLWKYVLKDSAAATIDTEDAILGCLDTSVFLTGSMPAETPVIAKTADYSIVNGDQVNVINANPTGGSFTLTLPSAVTVGDSWRVTIRNIGTANQVIVATVLSQTIDGQTSATLTLYLEAITLVSDGANFHISETANSPVVARRYVAAGAGFSLIGGNLIASVASNALTIAVKTAAGNDPSALSPVKVLIRGQAAADEEYSLITLTAATSIVVPDTATLGAANNSPFRIWIVGFNDAGTFRLGVINCRSGSNIYALGQFPIVNSTAISTGSDSAEVFYTGSGVTSKPYQILASATWESGLGTAGSWSSAPTRFELFSAGSKLPGDVVQMRSDETTTSGTTTSATLVSLTNGQSKAITPTSAANLIRATGIGTMGCNIAANMVLQLQRESTLVGQPIYYSFNAVGAAPTTVIAIDAPQTTSSRTYSFQGKTNTGTLSYPTANAGALLMLEELMV